MWQEDQEADCHFSYFFLLDNFAYVSNLYSRRLISYPLKHNHPTMLDASLQSMANLDKILGAPTVPHLRCGCAKTVPNSSGAPLHYEYHCTNMKTPKSEGRPGAPS